MPADALPNAEVICAALNERPDEWTGTSYVLAHKPTGIILWIGNGPLFLDSNDDSSSTNVHLGLLGRFKVWRVYKAWKRWQIAQLFAGKESVYAA